MVDLEIDSFCSLKEPLDDVMLHSGSFLHIQMALRTDYFVNLTFQGPNEVQLNG